jgi:hypothetical protein
VSGCWLMSVLHSVPAGQKTAAIAVHPPCPAAFSPSSTVRHHVSVSSAPVCSVCCRQWGTCC